VTNPELSSRGRKEGVPIDGMEGWTAAGIAAQLRLVDHAPVPPAILGNVGGAYVVIQHHLVGIHGRNHGSEHAAAAGQA
jgi:hypothetical protein